MKNEYLGSPTGYWVALAFFIITIAYTYFS